MSFQKALFHRVQYSIQKYIRMFINLITMTFKQQLKNEKKQAKNEANKKKKEAAMRKKFEEKLLKKTMKNPSTHPGYKFPKSERIEYLLLVHKTHLNEF